MKSVRPWICLGLCVILALFAGCSNHNAENQDALPPLNDPAALLGSWEGQVRLADGLPAISEVLLARLGCDDLTGILRLTAYQPDTVQAQWLLPFAAEATAFEEKVLTPLEKKKEAGDQEAAFALQKLNAYYDKYEHTALPDSMKESLLANYPGLKTHDRYLLRGHYPREREDLARYIQLAGGYTWADFEKDMALSGYAPQPEESECVAVTLPAYSLTLTFAVDGCYRVAADEAAVTAFGQSVEPCLRTLAEKLYRYHTKDALSEETMNALLADNQLAELGASFATAGTYTLEEGKLFLTSDKSVYDTCQLADDTLRFSSHEGAGTWAPALVYPITFTKVQ